MLKIKVLPLTPIELKQDFPDRDDENWLCHSLYDPTTKVLGKRHVNFEPHQVEAFPPKIRTY